MSRLERWGAIFCSSLTLLEVVLLTNHPSFWSQSLEETLATCGLQDNVQNVPYW
jgi:hypothetical protein